MNPAYRADQVGSLLRPSDLLAARDEVAAGSKTLADLRQIEDQAILDALAMQRATGIDVFSDGELRRRAWMTDLADAVEGFVPTHTTIQWHGPDGGPEGSHANVVGARLRQVRRLTAHESAFLKQHAPGPFKITVPSPSSFMHVSYKPGLSDQFYASREELVQELVTIIGNELKVLAEEGVPYIQLDAPYYVSYADEALRDQWRQMGADPDAEFEAAVAADDACLEGVAREGVTLAIHICRGNSRSRWLGAGGYERIAERLFGSLRVDRFLLEYDTDRAGGFEPLRFIPSGKTAVLGLITTKEPQLESPDELMLRIQEAARHVPLERLALSPQCGFASTAAGNNISEDDQRRKLELVAEVARRVWS